MNNVQYPAQDCNGNPIVLDAKGRISIDCLNDGERILINGTVDFSRIMQKISGEARAAENARRAQRGITAIDKDYTQLSLKNAEVQIKNPNGLTVNEMYARDRMLYTSNQHPEKGYCVTGYNKGNSLPTVYQRDANDPNSIQPIFPDGELAQDLKVTAMFRVFKPKRPGMHTGITLEAVICNEPVRTAQFGGASAALENLGFNVQPASPEDMAAAQARQAAAQQQAQAAQTPTGQPPINTAPNAYGAPQPQQPQQAYAPQPQGYNPQPSYPQQPGAAQPNNGGIPTNPYGGINLD